MTRLFGIVIVLALVFQPVLHAEDIAVAVPGKALANAGETLDEGEEELDLADELGLEEELEEDEFDQDDDAKTIDLTDNY
jgi:hypothetical protein